MADISKCSGEGCPLKETCYRYTAPNSLFWQAYGGYEYKDGKCDDYWNNKDYK